MPDLDWLPGVLIFLCVWAICMTIAVVCLAAAMLVSQL